MRHPLLLLQAVAVVATPPALSLGEWIALVSTGLVLAGVIYKSGVNSAETTHTRQLATGALAQVDQRLAKIEQFMEESHRDEVSWSQWRGIVDGRLDNLESSIDVKRGAH